MFAYYLKSLHNLREQNLELGKTTSQAYLDLVSSYLEGQYLFGKALLHPSARSLNPKKPDLDSFWSVHSDDGTHHKLILKWFDHHLEKNTQFNQLLLEAVQQHAAGLNALTDELVSKLKRDLPEEFAGNLNSLKAALASVTEAEGSLLSAAEATLTVDTQPVASKTKAASSTARRTPPVKANSSNE
jgi:hypothetical protein